MTKTIHESLLEITTSDKSMTGESPASKEQAEKLKKEIADTEALKALISSLKRIKASGKNMTKVLGKFF